MSAHPPGQGSPIDTASAASPVGPPFISLLLDDERMRADAVATLVAQLAGPETRVIHVDGRLRALLTLDHAGDAVARVLAERQGRETQVVLLVEDAETLPLGTVRALQVMAPHFVQAGRPALRVAFVGHPAFRALLAADEFAPLRQALGFESGQRGSGEPTTARRARRKALQIYGLAALALLVGVAGLVAWSLDGAPQANPPGLAATAASSPSAQPSPVTPLPESVAALEQPPPLPPPPVETAESASLHREFDAFLSSSGRSAASLTPAQRDALVAEFLSRRASQPVAPQPVASQPVASSPAAAPPATRATSSAMAVLRVVIHVADGQGAAVLAAQSQELLDGQVGKLQTRHVAATPKRPSIRYFYLEDAPAARLVERRLASLGLTWTIQDFTAAAVLPSPGTIEVWLPRQP